MGALENLRDILTRFATIESTAVNATETNARGPIHAVALSNQ